MDNIVMRKKFEGKLPEELHDPFVKAVQYVNTLPTAKALDFLWSLTYQAEDALNRIEMTSLKCATEEDDLTNLKYIPEELIIPLRNELRYQRKTMVDENFGEIIVSESIQDAFNAFYDSTSQDDIISSIVINACQIYVKTYTKPNIDRCIALLRSEQENYCFGGLRSLNFSYEEADYLKPFANNIGRLLVAMLEDEQEMCKPSSPFECLQDITFAANAPKCEERPAHDTMVEKTPVKEPLNAANIVANAEIIGDFLKAYKHLKDANLDHMEVISKSDAISKILDGITALG